MRCVTVLLAVVVFSPVALSYGSSRDQDRCMPFAQLTAVSFEQGMTTGRTRGPNVPRLHCAGNCPADAYLAAAQCQQVGMSDNALPSWKCVGDFPGSSSRESYSLGSIQVQCEGCARPGDPNIAKGSCSLRYSVQVNKGGGGGGEPTTTTTRTTTTTHRSPSYYNSGYWWSADDEILTTVFVVLLCIALAMVCFGNNNNNNNNNPNHPHQNYQNNNNNNNGAWGFGLGYLLGATRNNYWYDPWWRYNRGPNVVYHNTTTTTTTHNTTGSGGRGGGGGGGGGFGGSASL